MTRTYVKIGVAGSGKTALIERLLRRMNQQYSIGVITEKHFTYTFDPEHSVSTIGGSSASLDSVATAVAFDQREKE